MQHSDLVLAVNTLALVAFEECHFEYTAIAVVFGYGNTPMRLHTHMNDHSPIFGIITVGDYVGGASVSQKAPHHAQHSGPLLKYGSQHALFGSHEPSPYTHSGAQGRQA